MTMWNRDTVLRFIYAYRAKEILWHPKNRNGARVLREKAWAELSHEVGIPTHEVKKKIEHLLGQMRRENVKTRKAKARGQEKFVSTWYAYRHLRFLMDRKKLLLDPTTEGSDANPESQNEQIQFEESENEEEEDPLLEARTSQEIQTPNKQHRVQSLDTSSELLIPMAKKRRLVKPEIHTIASTSRPAVSPLRAEPAGPPAADECHLYANYFASKMRSYSQRTKNALQHHISVLLFQADNGEFDNVQTYQKFAYSPGDTPDSSVNSSLFQPMRSTRGLYITIDGENAVNEDASEDASDSNSIKSEK